MTRQFEHAGRTWKYENEKLYFLITAPVKIKGTKDDYELLPVWRVACVSNGISTFKRVAAMEAMRAA